MRNLVLIKFTADLSSPMLKFLHVTFQLTEWVLWRILAFGVEGNEMILSQKFADFVQAQTFLTVNIIEFIVLLFFVHSEGHHQVIELDIAENLRNVCWRDVGKVKIRLVFLGFGKKQIAHYRGEMQFVSMLRLILRCIRNSRFFI